MTTLRQWFDRFAEATGEQATDVVLGGDEWQDWRAENWPEWDGWNLVTAYSAVPAAILDRQFDSGFGGNESPNLCAWSPSWVMFSDNYDGAEGPCWLPRNPIPHPPTRPGGG